MKQCAWCDQPASTKSVYTAACENCRADNVRWNTARCVLNHALFEALADPSVRFVRAKWGESGAGGLREMIDDAVTEALSDSASDQETRSKPKEAPDVR